MKDKAEELIEKFQELQITMYGCSQDDFGTNPCIISNQMLTKSAIQCAIIAVDEILKTLPMYTGNLNPNWKFWDGVKQELKSRL